MTIDKVIVFAFCFIAASCLGQVYERTPTMNVGMCSQSVFNCSQTVRLANPGGLA